jgi:predicted transcriptional regulator
MTQIYFIPDIKNKIIDFVNKNWITVTDFCKLTWLSRCWYYKIINGNTKHFKIKTIERLKKVRIVW